MSNTPIYSLDGQTLKQWGVYVTDSSGIIDRPKLKTPPSASWDNYHGEDVYLDSLYFEPREITLSCLIVASSPSDLILKALLLEQRLSLKGLHRLAIEIVPDKPLVYEVYCKEAITISKRLEEGQCLGTFSLKLTEPQPLKRVLRYTTATNRGECSIQISTPKFVNIYWGDGTATEDVRGNNQTIKHKYTAGEVHYPIISGCIDEITALTTNATIVWEKL